MFVELSVHEVCRGPPRIFLINKIGVKRDLVVTLLFPDGME